MKNRKRYDSIDLIKCIAIFFVLLYHGTLVNYNIGEMSTLRNYFYYFLRTILSVCVPLFFFCNGFLLLNKEMNLRKHIIKCIHFIIITEIWGVCTLLVLMPIKGEFLTFSEFIKGLWTWKMGWINHLWYMGALIVIYIFFPLLKIVFDNSKKTMVYFFIMAVLFTFGNKALIMIINLFCADFSGNLFNMFNPFRGIYAYTFVYFILGGLTCYYQEDISRFLKSKKLSSGVMLIGSILISCICLGIYGVIVSKTQETAWDVVWNGYDTIFTLINVICITQLANNYTGNISFVKLISQNTLGIYFIHMILINLTKPVLTAELFTNSIIVNIIYAVIIGFVSLLITMGMKKIPLIKCLVL